MTVSSTLLSDVSDDYAVLVGTSGFSLRRPGWASAVEHVEAFRWSKAAGTEPLVDATLESWPIAMSGDGSVIFVAVQRADESFAVCRWTAATGCVELEPPAGLFPAYSYVGASSLRAGCSSNGDVIFLAFTNSLASEGEVTRWRWSEQAGWERGPGSAGPYLGAPGTYAGIQLDARGDALFTAAPGQGLAPSFWPRSGAPRALELHGFDECEPWLSREGSLIAGRCWNAPDGTPQAMRWSSSGAAETWDGPSFQHSATRDGSVIVGTRGKPEGSPETRVALRWTEQTGEQTLFEVDGFVRLWLSADGSAVFSVVGDVPITQYLRWNEESGSQVLPPLEVPATEVQAVSVRAEIIALSQPTAVGNDTVLMTESGNQNLLDQFAALGIEPNDLEPTRVRYIDDSGNYPVLIGEGNGEQGARIWIARLTEP